MATQDKKPDAADLKAGLGLGKGSSEGGLGGLSGGKGLGGLGGGSLSNSGGLGALSKSGGSPSLNNPSGGGLSGGGLSGGGLGGLGGGSLSGGSPALNKSGSASPLSKPSGGGLSGGGLSGGLGGLSQGVGLKGQQSEQPAGGPPPGAARPPFAGPPGGPRKPPTQTAKPAPKPAWEPPANDASAGTDVPIAEPRSMGKLIGLIGGFLLVAAIGGAIGFWFGDAQQQRKLFAAQTSDAQRILDVVKPRVEKVQALSAKVQAHNGEKPDADLLKLMGNRDFVVDSSGIFTNKLILGADITQNLVRFVADTQELSALLSTHIALTTKTDKEELDGLAQDIEMLKAAGFALIFDSENYVKSLQEKDDFVPPAGKIVTFDKQEPTVKDEEKFLKVRFPKSDKELDVPMKSMIMVARNDLIGSGGPNALVRYNRRHQAIAYKLKQMEYTTALIQSLEQLAGRGDAPVLSATKE